MHRQHGGAISVWFPSGPFLQTGLFPLPAKHQGRRQGLQERSAGTEHRRRAQHQFVELAVQFPGTRQAYSVRSARVPRGQRRLL